MNQWQAWVHIKWKPGTPQNAWQGWKNSSSIKGIWSTTGNWDCTIWVDVKNWDELEQFVWKEVRSNEWVERTETAWAKQWWSGSAKPENRASA